MRYRSVSSRFPFCGLGPRGQQAVPLSRIHTQISLHSLSGVSNFPANTTNTERVPRVPWHSLKTMIPEVGPVLDRLGPGWIYLHVLLPLADRQIQSNVVSSREWKEHRVQWRHDDAVAVGSPAAHELVRAGRGEATGDGAFVRDLKAGDVVTVWGKSRFPGWANHIKSVRVDVYWFL